jgi:nuclear receptor subfamily 4 group A protein 2
VGPSSAKCSPRAEADVVSRFFDVVASSVEASRGFAEKIPGFSELCREDQKLLYESASLELFVLRLAFR